MDRRKREGERQRAVWDAPPDRQTDRRPASQAGFLLLQARASSGHRRRLSHSACLAGVRCGVSQLCHRRAPGLLERQSLCRPAAGAMGNTSSVLGVRARGSAGFGGEGREEYGWSTVEDSVQAARTGIRFDACEGVELSSDGRTATSKSESPVAMRARLGRADDRPDAGGALRLGWQFEVTANHCGSAGFTVGLIAADASTKFSPTEGLWGYASGGQLRSPHQKPDRVVAFEAGDTIRVVLDLGEVAFYRNGDAVGRRQVAPGADLYPCVVLGSTGDRASISLRVPRTSISRKAAAWSNSGWARGDPLNDAFDHAKARRLYPDGGTVGPMRADEDVQPWLVEQHLWGTGLSADTLSSEAGRIVKAAHRRLAQHTDSSDPIRKIAEARAQMVTLLRDEILQDARTPYLTREQGGGLLAAAKDGLDSVSERTAKAVSSGSFKIFLLITTSVMKSDPEIANAALGTMLDTIESIESGVLAESHPDRPPHISEADLDSVNSFLHSLVVADDANIGQMAARCILVLADRRGQARHFFHAIQTLESAFASGRADWAESLAIETVNDILQATKAIERVGQVFSPQTRPDEPEPELSAASGVHDPTEQRACSGSSSSQEWFYLENTLSGLVLEIEGGSSQAHAKLWMSKKDENPSQMWAYDRSDGRLYSKASDCVLSISEDAHRERLCMAQKAVANPAASDDDRVSSQQWTLAETDHLGWSFLESRLNGWTAEVECGGDLTTREPAELREAFKPGRRSRAKLLMKPKNRTPAQLWRLVPKLGVDVGEQKQAKHWVIDPSKETFNFLTDMVRGQWARRLQQNHQPREPGDSKDSGARRCVADRSDEDLVTLVSLLRLNVEAVVSTSATVFTAYDIPYGVEGNAPLEGSLGLDFDVAAAVCISSFGVFDHGSKGLSNTIEVSVWCRDTQKEVGPRLSFTPEDPGILSGGARFKTLQDLLVLPAGFRGCIVAWGYGHEQLCGEVTGTGNQPYPVQDGDGALRFVGTSRSGSEPSQYPTQLEAGGCFRYLAGTFRFSVPSASVGGTSSSAVGSAEQYKETATTIMDCAQEIVTAYDSDDTALEATAEALSLQTTLWSEACHLLRAAAKLLYSASKYRHRLMMGVFEQKRSLSTTLITDGLLSNVASVADALSLLGPAEPALLNLDHVDAVLKVLAQLFDILGYDAPGDSRAQLLIPGASGASRTTKCCVFGIITAVAKVQSGILVHYIETPTVDSQALLDRYTSMLARVALQSIELAMQAPDPVAAVEHGVLAGLVPSWVVSLGSMQWNLLSDTTIGLLADLYAGIGRIVQATSLLAWSPQQEEIPWLIDLQLSLGHYAVTRLLRLGIEDISGTPRDQAPACAQRLLQYGRPTEKQTGDLGWDFLSGLTGESQFIEAVAAQAGMSVPDSDSDEDTTVVSIFKAMLHHGGLGRLAAQLSAASTFDEMPTAFIAAFEKAHQNVELEREVSNELDLSRTNSVKELIDQRAKAEFLMQFSAGGEFSADLAELPPDSPTKVDAGEVLNRTFSGKSRRKSAKAASIAKVATQLAAAARGDSSPDLHAVFTDVREFVSAHIDLDAVSGEISHVEKLARLRNNALQHVVRFLDGAPEKSLGALLLRRRIATLMFRGEQSAYTHFLVPFAGCGPEIANDLTRLYFEIVAACLDASDTSKVCCLAGLLACVWRPDDCVYLAQLQVWDMIASINGSTEGIAKSEVDLLRNSLQLATVMSLASVDSQTATPLLQTVLDGLVAAIEGPGCDAIASLPCLAFILSKQPVKASSQHVLANEANVVALLKVCFCMLAKCQDGFSDIAGTVMLLIRRGLSFATPLQADTALAQTPNGLNAGVLEYLAQISRDGVFGRPVDWEDERAISSQVSALGLEDCRIPDSAFRSSSDGGTTIMAAPPARLNGPVCWSATELDGDLTEHWLEVDLGTSFLCTAVSTQGATEQEAWTKAVTLSYSLDGIEFDVYSEMGMPKTFRANVDSWTVVHLKLMEPFVAKVLRIHPVEFQLAPALRAEVFGVAPPADPQDCRVLATSMLIDLPKVSQSWQTACNAFVSRTFEDWRQGGDGRVALQVCGGYAETIRSGALVTLHGATKRILQVEKDTVFLLDSTYGSVSQEPTSAELKPLCEFKLDPALLDQLIELCTSKCTCLTDITAGSAEVVGVSWRDVEETMLAVRAIVEFAATLKHDAAVKIARQELFRPLLALSVKGQPSAGLDPEISSLEERVAVLKPLLYQATDAVRQVLYGTSKNLRADMALITKYTLGPASSRAYTCTEITKAGGARVAIQCLRDCLEKLRVGESVVDSPLSSLPATAAVVPAAISGQKRKPKVTKIWHPEELRWGNCDTCQICIVDKGEPTVGSRDEYQAIAAEQSGRMPSCQYPGAGNAYSHGSNERALYDAARKVATETLYPNFPDCNADSILVLHGNLDDGWAHNNEEGSMHAWRHPDEESHEADTYAWCRGGASAEKRFHIYVCADCTAPPCTSVSSNTSDTDGRQADLKGLSLMVSGVATLQNIVLYTSDETAAKVARCGGVQVLADLLSYYENEQISLPRHPAAGRSTSALVPRMVQVKPAGDQGLSEFVKSDEVFLAQPFPISDAANMAGFVGCKVVATNPAESPLAWWGAEVTGIEQQGMQLKLRFDDGCEASQVPSQIHISKRLEQALPPTGTDVLVLRRSYLHNGNGPFHEYAMARMEAAVESFAQPESQSESEPLDSLADIALRSADLQPELEPEPELESGCPEGIAPHDNSPELLNLISMGFSRDASIRALAEAKNNPTVAASLLADIGDAILSQPLPEGAYHIPNKFAALMIKPAMILRLVETLHAFSLRINQLMFGERAVAVLAQLLAVLTEQADDLLSPIPQAGEPLGMSIKAIGDGQVKASSTWSYGVGKDSDGHAAKFGRLHSVAGVGAWVAGVNDRDQWLEIDLRTLHWVTSVATQGRALAGTRHPNKSEWVTAYSVAVSVNGHDWQTVDDFVGNTDSESVVTNQFCVPVEARYVRILPTAWNGHISMRAEIYGRDPQQVQALLCRIKTYTAFTLANITTRTDDPIDDDYLGLLVSSGSIVEDCGRIIADVLNAPDDGSDDEQDLEEPPAFVLPEFLPEYQEIHSPSDGGRFTNVGNTVELEGSSNYCLSVLNIPFPSTGRHTAVVRVHRAPENCGIGVVQSFSAVCEHARGSKAWIGNGNAGWCLFKDGDSAHDGAWKGGNYSQYGIRDGGLVGVTFDADEHTISFSSNGNEKRAVYSGLPDKVFLAVSLYKCGKFELESVDWEQLAEDGEAAGVKDARSEISHIWSKKPNGSDSVMWLWVYIPDSENGGVTFKYRDGPGSWSEWSSQPTNMHNGWWHTAGWNRGYERYEHSCWFGGQAVVDKIHAPNICELEVPESGCFLIPETNKHSASMETEDRLLDTLSVDRFAGPAAFTLATLAQSSVFRQQMCASGVISSLTRLCANKTAALPGLRTSALADLALQRLQADASSRGHVLAAREDDADAANVVFGGEAMTPRPAFGLPEPEPEDTGMLSTPKPVPVQGSMVYPRAWISELRPVHTSVGYGELGVGAELGYESKKITVGGTAYYHGLSMHPPSSGKAYATFELPEDLNDATMTVGVALNDDVETSSSPLTFKVVADGEVIWTSEAVQARNVLKSCELELEAVQSVRFEVHCEGDNPNAHAVWVDPQVKGKTLRHWSTTEFHIRNDTDEERGHWKQIALEGGVEAKVNLADSSQPKLQERVEVIEAVRAVRPQRVHSELCLSSTNLTQLYALRAVLNIVQYVSAEIGFMDRAPNDVDMFVELFEKATVVKFGDDKVDAMIKTFVRVLAVQGEIGNLLAKQLSKLCGASLSDSSHSAPEHVRIEVATRCLKNVVSDSSVLLTRGADVLLSESGFVQLVSAVCSTTGQLRRQVIDVFNAVCYEGSRYLPDKTLDPSLGTCLRKLYWAEYSASDAKRGGFGTRTLNTFANMMIAWSSIPANKITRPDWTYEQRQLLVALTALQMECDADFDMSPVLLVDGHYKEKTIMSLQSYLNKQLLHVAEMLKIDGLLGSCTIFNFQIFLNMHLPPPHRVKVNGLWSTAEDTALTMFLNSRWDQAGYQDRKLREDGNTRQQPSNIVKALQTYLNSVHGESQTWTPVFRQQSEHAGGAWVPKGAVDKQLQDINPSDPSAPLFSTLSSTDWSQLRNRHGALTFRMSFPNSELKPLVWSQDSAPTATGVDGFVGLDTRSYSHFNGLARSNAPDKAVLSAPGRGAHRRTFMYSIGAIQPWTAPPRSALTADTDAAWDCEGEGVMTCEDHILEVKDGAGYSVFVCKEPFPASGTNVVEVMIDKRQENMGIGICTSLEDLKRHSRQNKAWIGNGGHGWCLFNDGDCAHDGSWKGGSYSDYAYGTGDKVQVVFDAERKSIGWVVNGNRREHVYTGLGETAYFCISFYKRGQAQLLTSSFPMSRLPDPEPDHQLRCHGVEQELIRAYRRGSADATLPDEPILANYYKYEDPPGMRGPCVQGRELLIHDVMLEVLQPENAQARFHTAVVSLHSTFVAHTQEPLLTFAVSDFLKQFGPWSSAASCIEACGFRAVSKSLESESESESESDHGIPLLEAVPEPEPEPAPEQDVPPGLSALIAMELGDVGQCTKAFEFADGDVDTAIQVLLSGDIPPSEPSTSHTPAPAPAPAPAPESTTNAPSGSSQVERSPRAEFPRLPPTPRPTPQPSYVDSSGQRHIGVQFVDTDGDKVAFRVNRTDPDRELGLLDYIVGDTVQVPGVGTLDLQEDGVIRVHNSWITTPQDDERLSVHRTLREMWDVAQVNREISGTKLWMRCVLPVRESVSANREHGGDDEFVFSTHTGNETGQHTLCGGSRVPVTVQGPGYQGAVEIADRELILADPAKTYALGNEWSIVAWQRFPLQRTGPDDQHVLTTSLFGTEVEHHVLFQGSQLGVYFDSTPPFFFPCVNGVQGEETPFCAARLSDGWHHIAALGSAGATHFFVDGQPVGLARAQVTGPLTCIGNRIKSACLDSNVGGLVDGAPIEGGLASWGQLADFRAISRKITHAEIEQLTGGGSFLATAAAAAAAAAAAQRSALNDRLRAGEPPRHRLVNLRYQYNAAGQANAGSHAESLRHVLDAVRANPKVLQTYQEGKSHVVEEGALAMLMLAMDAAQCISSKRDLPIALRLESHALEAKAPVPLFPSFDRGRTRTAGPGTITVADGVFTLENGHASSYSMCVCDVPFPETGVHTIKVTIHAMGDCAGIGVVTSFEDAKEHRNGSKAWIGNGPSGWCLFNDGDCCHNASWNSGSLRFNSGREVAIRIDADNGTFTPIVDGVARENAYTNLPKGLYFAVAMRPSGRIEIDSSSCGSSTKGDAKNDWAEMIHRQYANGTPRREEQIPPGWRLMEMGSWTHRDDAELVMLMNHVANAHPAGSVALEGLLDESVLLNLSRDGGLRSFARIEGRESAMIIARAKVLERLSQAVTSPCVVCMQYLYA